MPGIISATSASMNIRLIRYVLLLVFAKGSFIHLAINSVTLSNVLLSNLYSSNLAILFLQSSVLKGTGMGWSFDLLVYSPIFPWS